MIATDQHNRPRVQTFIAQQQAHRLYRIVPPIHIIPQKHIFLASHIRYYIIDEVPQIVELAMDIPDDVLSAFYFHDIWLLE